MAFTVKEQINGTAAFAARPAPPAVPNGHQRRFLTLPAGRGTQGPHAVRTRPAPGSEVVRNVPCPCPSSSACNPLPSAPAKPTRSPFSGLNAVACLPLDGPVWDLTELDGYETPIKDGHLTDVVTGDLDNDGRKDLVFLETAKNYLDVVLFDADHKLFGQPLAGVRGTHLPRAPRRFPRTREAVVADVYRRRQERPHHRRPRPHYRLSAGVTGRETATAT